MWVVAIATIFGDRRVFPKVRSAFLGVAIEARIVERLLYELQIVRCTMRAMTAAAVHFSLSNRMRVRLQ